MQAGDRIPDVPATLDDGRTVPLSELAADGPLVVFSYPKAFTGGCTAESCHFRDLAAEFADAGATRVGLSRDDVETQARFRAELGLDYPLIADADGSVSKVLDVKRPGPLWSKRKTIVLDTDLTVLGVISSESDMEVHADEALDILRTHAGARR